jgi:hypothetical protein
MSLDWVIYNRLQDLLLDSQDSTRILFADRGGFLPRAGDHHGHARHLLRFYLSH